MKWKTLISKVTDSTDWELDGFPQQVLGSTYLESPEQEITGTIDLLIIMEWVSDHFTQTIKRSLTERIDSENDPERRIDEAIGVIDYGNDYLIDMITHLRDSLESK